MKLFKKLSSWLKKKVSRLLESDKPYWIYYYRPNKKKGRKLYLWISARLGPTLVSNKKMASLYPDPKEDKWWGKWKLRKEKI